MARPSEWRRPSLRTTGSIFNCCSHGTLLHVPTQRLFTLETLRIWVRPARDLHPLPGFSAAIESSPDGRRQNRRCFLLKAWPSLPGRTHSRKPCPSQRKREFSPGSRRFPDQSCCRTGRPTAPICICTTAFYPFIC